MPSNDIPSIPLQKSMTPALKTLDISSASRQSSDPSKPPRIPTMLSKVTISALKAENPQIAHLFGSNYAPSDSQLEIIRRNLDAAKAEQLKYRRMKPPGRHSYGQQSRTFMHNMQQIDTTIAYWKSLLVPIRRIPPEILCHIFSFLLNLPWEQPAIASRRRLPVNAPLLLLHVCQLWRRLASSTRPLWRQLPDIFLDEVKFNLIEGRLALLLKHVDLAKHDLIISIEGREKESNIYWNWLQGSSRESNPRLLVDFLCQTSRLWSECTISAPIASLKHLANVKGNTPNLRKLTLFFGDRSIQSFFSSMETVDLFKHTPLLESLHLAGPHDGRISMPIHQLKHLKDHSLGRFASDRLLQYPVYPNLVYLELTDRRMESFTMLQFPRLQHLQIDCQIDIETGCVPRAIFPCLMKLVVSAKESGTGDILGVIERAIRRSDCTAMESLSVYYAHDDRAENRPRTSLSCLLAATSNLSHLDLLANPTDIQTLATLYSRENESSHSLQSCNIHIATPIRSDTSAAIQRLASSWQRSSCWPDITTSPCSAFKKRTLKICPYKSASLCDPPQRPMATPAMLERWFSDPRKSILHALSTKLRGTNNGKNACAMKPTLQIWSHFNNSRLEFANILTEVELYNPQNANEILVSIFDLTASNRPTTLASI
ncbi:hypothetical protein D9619_001343 [Psilocybe cf. subviscida]|uniref:F-box domain-containing protein n=1 Tax=Psilocybe cf. subviscida TaxID=2480587 RepID=A0A8H5BGT4_9AGAR|nr:hypothetical protein D9619_001343 [Psilocybe cf. subviscida]